MPRRVVVKGDGAEVLIELGEGAVPDELYARLPFETKARIEGNEMRLPVMVPPAVEAADRGEIETGDVAYMPEENALCVFFGPEDETRAGEVTKVGRALEGLKSCREIKANQTLRLEAAE